MCACECVRVSACAYECVTCAILDVLLAGSFGGLLVTGARPSVISCSQTHVCALICSDIIRCLRIRFKASVLLCVDARVCNVCAHLCANARARARTLMRTYPCGLIITLVHG